MSSGNPFRASQAFPQPAPVPQASFIKTDSSVLEAHRGDSDHVLEDAAAPPAKTKKSVRIVSPTTTIPPQPNFDDENATLNELMARRSSQGPPASPPPPVTPAGFANHSVTAGEANAQVVGKDAMATADALPGTKSYFGGPQAAHSPRNIPANPFAKTLASLESHEREGGTEERANAQRPAPGNNRASLDVESFKNLLMTGRPTPRASGASAQPGSASHSASSAQFDSSSTDASSVSRQSISELPHEPHLDSSRTSDDMAGDDDDENMRFASEAKKSKKKPPPAPKPRHGKPVAPRQPQVVSFDNFEATEPAPTPGIRRTDSSDSSKPLPPTPSAQQQPTSAGSPDFTPPQSRPLSLRLSDLPKSPEEQAKPKKTPPPVPLARRQSQLKSTSLENRPRSSSNLTISSQHSIEAPQTPTSISHDPMSSAKSPPPPPPSRYGARLANIGNSSANSSSTELAQSSSSIRTPRSVPDPPSHRQGMFDSEASSPAPSIHRTSSVSSSRNMPRNVSGGSTGSQMPPPPPPRRRQSNRSSLDQQRPMPFSSTSPTESRRTSTEYRRTSYEHRRTSVTSESSLRREYARSDVKGENEYALYSPVDEKDRPLGHGAGAEEKSSVPNTMKTSTKDGSADSSTITAEARSNSNNILDDMEKFQREIDELRVRYKHVA